jgi:phage pi2 protein 07
MPFELVLWSAEDIAGYLRRASPRVVTDRIVTAPDFPKPVRLTNGKSTSYPLYKAIEVVQYVEKFKEAA